jgi:hypothetical protein
MSPNDSAVLSLERFEVGCDSSSSSPNSANDTGDDFTLRRRRAELESPDWADDEEDDGVELKRVARRRRRTPRTRRTTSLTRRRGSRR